MNKFMKVLAGVVTVIVGSPSVGVAAQDAQIADIAKAHVEEVARQGPFIMIPEEVEAVKRQHPELRVSDQELFNALHDAAVAKGGMLIGLEWND